MTRLEATARVTSILSQTEGYSVERPDENLFKAVSTNEKRRSSFFVRIGTRGNIRLWLDGVDESESARGRDAWTCLVINASAEG